MTPPHAQRSRLSQTAAATSFELLSAAAWAQFISPNLLGGNWLLRRARPQEIANGGQLIQRETSIAERNRALLPQDRPASVDASRLPYGGRRLLDLFSDFNRLAGSSLVLAKVRQPFGDIGPIPD